MRTRTVWILVAAVVLTPVVLIGLAVEFLFGLTQVLYKPVRYRVAAAVEVTDGDRQLRSVVHSDCWGFVSTRGIARGTQKSRKGEDNHVLLPDGSILVLPNLEPCRWVAPRPAAGTSAVLTPQRPGVSADQAGLIWAEEAWRFDNIHAPSRVTVYDLRQLFEQGSGGLKVASATATVVRPGPQTAVTFALEDHFPWLRQVPRYDSLKSYQLYRDRHHHGNFLGFRATVTQLVGGSRCPAPDPDAEGPIVIPVQSPCTFVNNCQRGHEKLYCGRAIGWLAGTVNADFSEVSFSIDRASDGVTAVLYREPVLKAAGAPGEPMQQSLRWKPRLCVDGTCVQAAVTWSGGSPWNELYYPKRNQFVTVWPLTFYAADAFRRSGASY